MKFLLKIPVPLLPAPSIHGVENFTQRRIVAAAVEFAFSRIFDIFGPV